jgi:alanine racemase
MEKNDFLHNTRIEITVFKLHRITAQSGKKTRIHLKLETGTHRQGMNRQELDWYLQKLPEMPGIIPEGAYTHFANIEDTTSHDYANFQSGETAAPGAYLEEPRHPAKTSPGRRYDWLWPYL